MAGKNEKANDGPAREIVITRLLHAPREQVYKAWTDPLHLIQWWGPNGFTNTFHEIDIRPGGVWRFTMHGADGTDYANKVIFTEVVPPERIAYTLTGPGEAPNMTFHVTVTFETEGSKTRLTMISVFDTAEDFRRMTEDFRAVENNHQMLHRLEQELERMG